MGVVRVDRAFVFLQIWRNPCSIDWAFKMTPKMSLNMRCLKPAASRQLPENPKCWPDLLLSELLLPELLLPARVLL